MELKDILGIINASWLERMEYFLKKNVHGSSK